MSLNTHQDTNFTKSVKNLSQQIFGKNLLQQLKLDQFNEQMQQLGRRKVKKLPDYETWITVMTRKGLANRIDDIAIAFRGSGLPPYIVSQIINEDLKVPAWSLYEIQQHIRPILYRDETTDTDYEYNLVDLTTGKLKPIPLPQ